MGWPCPTKREERVERLTAIIEAGTTAADKLKAVDSSAKAPTRKDTYLAKGITALKEAKDLLKLAAKAEAEAATTAAKEKKKAEAAAARAASLVAQEQDRAERAAQKKAAAEATVARLEAARSKWFPRLTGEQ